MKHFLGKIKSKHTIYTLILLLGVLVPLTRYYASTPEDNDCMTEYVKNMSSSEYKGTIFNIDGAYHIEANNSKMINSLNKYKVGEAKGCIMNTGNLFSDINNTIYCSMTYAIQNAPIYHKTKEPLALMKGEAIQNLEKKLEAFGI